MSYSATWNTLIVLTRRNASEEITRIMSDQWGASGFCRTLAVVVLKRRSTSDGDRHSGVRSSIVGTVSLMLLQKPTIIGPTVVRFACLLKIVGSTLQFQTEMEYDIMIITDERLEKAESNECFVVHWGRSKITQIERASFSPFGRNGQKIGSNCCAPSRKETKLLTLLFSLTKWSYRNLTQDINAQ